MSKSFFSQQMQTVGSDYTSIFTSLYQLPNKTQYCHHNTTSYARHKALDTTYEALSDLKDDIIEKIIGYSGVRPQNISLQPLTGYSESMDIQVADEIMAFGKKLEEWAAVKEYCDIENLAQEYSGVGAKLKYLTTLS